MFVQKNTYQVNANQSILKESRPTLIMVMVFQMHAFVKTKQTVHFKYVQFMMCQLHLVYTLIRIPYPSLYYCFPFHHKTHSISYSNHQPSS